MTIKRIATEVARISANIRKTAPMRPNSIVRTHQARLGQMDTLLKSAQRELSAATKAKMTPADSLAAVKAQKDLTSAKAQLGKLTVAAKSVDRKKGIR